MSTTENRGQFGSKLGFILSAAGSAVGLGNIWKFPGKAYNCGGGAFLLVYIIMVALIGTTVMMAEFTVGRNAHKNALGSFRAISQKWGFAGGLGVLTGFIILCYYCQVGGWTMKYIYAYIAEAKMVYADPTAYFLGMLGANGFPLQGAVIFPLIFLFLTAFILSHGTAGIEKMSKVLMPLLFVLLIGLMIRSCTLPGADVGLKYMLNVDFSTINSNAILVALGQAFFSLSLGMGIMVTYASYLSDEDNLISNTGIVCVLDTLVALFAGFMIIPAVFATGIDPRWAAASHSQHWQAYLKQSRRTLFGLLFYFLLFFAAVTSSTSIMEGTIAFLIEEKGLKRNQCTAWYIRCCIHHRRILHTVSGLHEHQGYLGFQERYRIPHLRRLPGIPDRQTAAASGCILYNCIRWLDLGYRQFRRGSYLLWQVQIHPCTCIQIHR